MTGVNILCQCGRWPDGGERHSVLVRAVLERQGAKNTSVDTDEGFTDPFLPLTCSEVIPICEQRIINDDPGRFQGYYESLNAMRPLLRSKEWLQSVTGYYVNVAGKQDAVRLSYWTTAPEQTRKIVNLFVSQNGLKHIEEPIIPEHTRNSTG